MADLLPRFFAWGGPSRYKWSLGWWTGTEWDRLCVVRRPATRDAAERSLSPVCASRPLAVLGFLAKRMLLAVDDNLHDPFRWQRG